MLHGTCLSLWQYDKVNSSRLMRHLIVDEGNSLIAVRLRSNLFKDFISSTISNFLTFLLSLIFNSSKFGNLER
ncbi:hypothetical protein RchiOBHm_Chr5g0080941 [Rosa chinensis]|uniref:Uncharacterized protein n=1 Tax=Rosa chinensis TaxID=74649 RepID=A0A2P6QMW2_ROSCH|nr:hypothetical protein RchiOBHm_Chr5g0080941 [Rosa chinensis]